MKSSILFAVCLLASLAMLAACKTRVCDDESSIDKCSLCCASHEFNKFDHKLHLESGRCRCYKDESEFKRMEHSAKRQKVVATDE
ncbi:hypothetical protein SUGI_1512260 [Cryptomeria japonica]|uniref:Uncharacterized protein n=1 Tax=Cryptomeria japonica TaxID=3369 RepID=A0AAD3RRR8_CRYJA|nr:hypothetical protein SUGI_1512260 [Cryptomeria japonica]